MLAFEVNAAGYYSDTLLARERSGRPIATPDAQIAAMCLAHHAVCATRSTKDFVGTGIGPADPGVD